VQRKKQRGYVWRLLFDFHLPERYPRQVIKRFAPAVCGSFSVFWQDFGEF